MAGNPGAIGRRFHTQFTLRLPDDLHARVVAAASANGRSLNTEIAQLLEAALPADAEKAPITDGANTRDSVALASLPLVAEITHGGSVAYLHPDYYPAIARDAFAMADAFIAARAEGGAE